MGRPAGDHRLPNVPPPLGRPFAPAHYIAAELAISEVCNDKSALAEGGIGTGVQSRHRAISEPR